MSSRTIKILTVLALAVCALGMEAQMLPNPYGPPITVENAKKAAAAALAEAVKNHWTMAVAIVGPDGTLIYYEKMDNTQLGSANVSGFAGQRRRWHARAGTGRRCPGGRRYSSSCRRQNHWRDWRFWRYQRPRRRLRHGRGSNH
jgi:hypothetical protein